MSCINWLGKATPYLPLREEWIGWTRNQQERRKHFIVKQTHLMVLTEYRDRSGLTTRILKECTKRLSEDWEQTWGHPLLLAESFIDPNYCLVSRHRDAGAINPAIDLGYGLKWLGTYQLRPSARRLLKVKGSPKILEYTKKGKKIFVGRFCYFYGSFLLYSRSKKWTKYTPPISCGI